MKIRHDDIIIDEKEPFKNCKLGRKQYATVLTGIVNTYKDGFVMGLNNEWGGGKTTFVKMWQKHLEIDGFKTIYFNAWENDFDTNPLVAIMAELEGLTDADKDKLNDLLKIGGTLIKNTPEALIKGVAGRILSVDTYEDAIDTSDIFKKEIKKYNNKKKAIGEFKIKLEEYIDSATPDKPLIFIIDELDRCRPDYAVEVLENVKHLFSIKGITFVLSIDKVHLASSIRGYYGSENINTDEYLRRFIDLEYSLPEPEPKLFIEYLYEYYGFDEFMTNASDIEYEKNSLIDMANYLFKKTYTTLRQQEDIFGLTGLVLQSLQGYRKKTTHLLFVLIYLKMFQNNFYEKIYKQKLLPQQLNNEYTSIVGGTKTKYGLNYTYVRALLIYLYHNGLNYDTKAKHPIEGKNSEGFTVSLIKDIDDNSNFTLTNGFKTVYENQMHGISLNDILDKINLTEPIINQSI